MADQTSAANPSPKIYRYPLNFLDAQSDYMKIDVVKYVPPKISSGGAGLAIPGNSQTRIDTALNQKGKESLLTSMLLPMPLTLQDNKKTAWERGDMDFIAATVGNYAKSLINAEGGSLGNFTNNAYTQTASAINSMAGAAGGVGELAREYISNVMINMVSGANLPFQQQLARERGIVINPNAEFLFTGPSLRSFAFAYTFVPRNRKEAEQVRMIVRTFKKAMSPKASIELQGFGNSADALRRGFLQVPDVFKIQYMQGAKPHPFLHKFKYCALTQVGVDYTAASNGQGYISYDDGTPVGTTLSLAFTELTPIYAEDYGDESDKNDKRLNGVGY